MIRRAHSGYARLAAAFAALACAAPAPSTAPTPAEPLHPNEQRAVARADSLRASLLRASQWVDFSSPGCDEGVLRTFPSDTNPEMSSATEHQVGDLERLIVAWGVDESLDTPRGRELLKTVVEWEGGLVRPNWDVLAPATPRRAIAAGLGGTYADPKTGKCTAIAGPDTTMVAIPPTLTAVTAPRGAVKIVVGDSGIAAMRDAFAAKHRGDTTAVLTYARVRTAVVWREWGLVAVHRPAERGGMLLLSQGAGGASYIFRRVGNEWRLVLITRTWG